MPVHDYKTEQRKTVRKSYFESTRGKRVDALAAFDVYVRGVRITGKPSDGYEDYEWISGVDIPPAVAAEMTKRVIEYRKLRSSLGEKDAMEAINRMRSSSEVFVRFKEITFY